MNSDTASVWAFGHPEFGVHLTLFQPGGQIIPTTLLLSHSEIVGSYLTLAKFMVCF